MSISAHRPATLSDTCRRAGIILELRTLPPSKAREALPAIGSELIMPRGKIVSFEEAASHIPSGTTISVSSSSGLGCPDAMLKAIGARFDATGEPKRLTTIHP